MKPTSTMKDYGSTRYRFSRSRHHHLGIASRGWLFSSWFLTRPLDTHTFIDRGEATDHNARVCQPANHLVLSQEEEGKSRHMYCHISCPFTLSCCPESRNGFPLGSQSSKECRKEHHGESTRESAEGNLCAARPNIALVVGKKGVETM